MSVKTFSVCGLNVIMLALVLSLSALTQGLGNAWAEKPKADSYKMAVPSSALDKPAASSYVISPSLALTQGLGYAWADKPTTGSYKPSTAYSYNSSGGAINIKRSGVGTYQVLFSGLGRKGKPGGNVQVTAYGSGSESCKVASWGSGGADFAANVRCFKASGAPVDTKYTIQVVWPNTNIVKTGYAWADKPTTGSYKPSTAYSYNSSGGAINIKRSGVGAYQVLFSRLGRKGKAGGNVQVTAYGSGSESCKVVSWGSGGADFAANVHCFTASGAPVDTRYTINVAW